MDFLTSYKIYASGTEASPNYHQWCGLSVLASVISRRVWIMQGRFRVNPNLYIILVGDPAEGKSIAMAFAKRMVGELARTSPTKHPFIVSGSITKESLTQAMGTQPANATPTGCQQIVTIDGRVEEIAHVSVFGNELVTFLGDPPGKMIDFLTDIYDRDDFSVLTKNKGNDFIAGPFINILGGLTPNTLRSLAQQQLINGGFTRRCNFIYSAGRGSPIPRPLLSEEQNLAYQSCISHCRELASTKGQFKWTPEAETFFDAWYYKKDKIMASQSSIALRGYYRSLDQMLLRVGMLVSLAQGSSLILDVPHLEEGLKILDGLEDYLNKTFAGSGRNELAGISAHMVEYLAQQGKPVLRKKLSAMFWSDAKAEDFQACLTHLASIGKIKLGTITNPTPGQMPIDTVELLT